MPEFRSAWLNFRPENTPESTGDGTDKTDKSPSVSFVSESTWASGRKTRLADRVLGALAPGGWRTVDDLAALLAVPQPAALAAVRALAAAGRIARSPASVGGTGLWRLAQPGEPLVRTR